MASKARLRIQGIPAATSSELARFLARSLPAPQAQRIGDWAELIENRKAAIDAAIASPGTGVEPAALLVGWTRFVRADLDAALDRFEPLVEARRLDAAAASPYARVLAVRLALNRRPSARAFFDRVMPGDYDEQAHEWHARAALWARDWPRVERVIAAMPAELAAQPRWRYFTARAAEARGEDVLAGEIYAEVTAGSNWYAVLASARLGRPFAPRPEPLPLAPARLDEIEARPAFARARELHYAGPHALAHSEWNDAFASLPPDGQVQAVGLAGRWGPPPSAVPRGAPSSPASTPRTMAT